MLRHTVEGVRLSLTISLILATRWQAGRAKIYFSVNVAGGNILDCSLHLVRVYYELVFHVCVGYLELDEIAWLRMDSARWQGRDLTTAVTKTHPIAVNYDYDLVIHSPDKTASR